jgi:hypothetical protein
MWCQTSSGLRCLPAQTFTCQRVIEVDAAELVAAALHGLNHLVDSEAIGIARLDRSNLIRSQGDAELARRRRVQREAL